MSENAELIFSETEVKWRQACDLCGFDCGMIVDPGLVRVLLKLRTSSHRIILLFHCYLYQ